MDLVEIIENICNELDISFHYGNKSHLNLIDQNGALEPDKIYVLLFPITRGRLDKNTSSRQVSGNFFLVTPDYFAQDYYNNTVSVENVNKYRDKIKPLIHKLDVFSQKMEYCYGVELTLFNSVEVVDILDANLTGFWVTFNGILYE